MRLTPVFFSWLTSAAQFPALRAGGVRAAHTGKRALLPFLVLVCVALFIDLTYIFPPQLLALCGDIRLANWRNQVALLLEHVQWLPLSNAVMIGHALLEPGSGARKAAGVALMFVGMLLVMEACRLLLQAMGWPWSAAWLAFSMILSAVASGMMRRSS